MVYAVLALVGAALIAAGLAVWSVPAGLIAAGAELIVAAYAFAYAAARKEPAARPTRHPGGVRVA